MARNNKTNGNSSTNSFSFSLAGLLAFSAVLIIASALVAGRVSALTPSKFSFVQNDVPDPDLQDKDFAIHKGRWGELLVQNIILERPEEYIKPEQNLAAAEKWTFGNMTLEGTKKFLIANGLPEQQAESQLTPEHAVQTESNSIVTPAEDFLWSLAPEVRTKLYMAFYGRDIGLYFDYPYIFSPDVIQAIYTDPQLHPDDVADLKRLVYPVNHSIWFSDPELLLRKMPTVERRTKMVKALSRLSAALARICIRPDSDIDKIASYWGAMDNVRFTDLRPMVEALKGLPHGGTVSLMYFLPPFARTRLFTFPAPAAKGDPAMDCHWTTFNFSSIEPDNRFNDAAFAVAFILKNYYRIDSPTQYGDVILYANKKDEIKHSAIYLADDLAFTKYGNNYAQPWMIVHLSSMQETYPALSPIYYRKKTQ